MQASWLYEMRVEISAKGVYNAKFASRHTVNEMVNVLTTLDLVFLDIRLLALVGC